MKIKEIVLVLRKDGVFHFQNRLIPSVRPGSGFAVGLLLEASEVDKDFNLAPGEGLLFISAKDIKEIMEALDKSDKLTFEMLKAPWGGERPRKLKVTDFI